jgi:hypothetical protein
MLSSGGSQSLLCPYIPFGWPESDEPTVAPGGTVGRVNAFYQGDFMARFR